MFLNIFQISHYFLLRLRGIILAYGKLYLKSAEGKFLNDGAFIHMDVISEFYIFRPTPGALVESVVTKKSISHVSCLVHGLFNVSCYGPTGKDAKGQDWVGKKVKLGEVVNVKIGEIDDSTRIPHISGAIVRLTEDREGPRLPRTGVTNVCEVRPEDFARMARAVADAPMGNMPPSKLPKLASAKEQQTTNNETPAKAKETPSEAKETPSKAKGTKDKKRKAEESTSESPKKKRKKMDKSQTEEEAVTSSPSKKKKATEMSVVESPKKKKKKVKEEVFKKEELENLLTVSGYSHDSSPVMNGVEKTKKKKKKDKERMEERSVVEETPSKKKKKKKSKETE